MAFNQEEYNIIFEAYRSNTLSILKEEYDNGRITGSEYATSLVQVLGTAVEQTAQTQQAQEKMEAETSIAKAKMIKENELTDAKTKLTLKQIDEVDNKLKMQLTKNDKDIEKISHEISKIDAEVAIAQEKLKIEQAKLKLEQDKTNAEITLTNKKIDLEQQQLDFNKEMYPKLLALKQAEIDNQKAQIQKITDDKYLEMFKVQMDAWSLMFTTGELEDKPSIISDDRVTELYNYLADY